MTEIKNILSDVSNLSVVGDFRLGDDTHNTYIQQESNQHKVYFEEITIDSHEFQGYLLPTFTTILTEKLEKNRILFLGGGYNFNTNMFMKYLACQPNHGDSPLRIKESMGLPGIYSLLHTIQKENTHCVFLIYRANPESLEYNFNELKKIISSGKHYILISTNTPKETWHFDDLESDDMWYEIPTKHAYLKEQLLQKMEAGLQEKNLALPTYFDLKKTSMDLGAPENIEIFIEKLSEQDLITPDSIQSCLSYASPGSASGISQWFQNLQNDQKLLALGLTLFSGLREVQFFDAMDILIEQGWAGRNHTLKPLDYQDIFPLLSYYKIENGYILAKYPEQNAKLLTIAWKTHRRFIDAALPVLVGLVIQSTSEEASNWKLFGAQWLRHIIRQVITTSLTSLGEIDFSSIEHTLISLAASEYFDVRLVSAETLANLRPKMGDRWYQVLDDWQTNLEIQNLVSSLIAGLPEGEHKTEETNTPLNYIQATIAAALGAVAQKDNINKLDKRVLVQVKRMARLRNKLVVKSVQHTLRLISARHTLQVAESLREDFLIHSIFIEPIAAGLADGYNNLDPLAVRSVLFQWIDQINHNPVQRKNYSDLLHEDKVLCCVIITFQWIDYQLTSSDGKITVEEAYETLDFLRQYNHQPRVRAYLLKAIVSLIEEHLRDPTHQTISYISNLDEKERDQLVLAFRRQYLIQRAAQTGGDYRMRISGQLIPIWEIESDRPKTNVEQLMKEWLNHQDKAISQIATMALIKFTEVEDQEKQSIDAYIEEQNRLSDLQDETEEEIPHYDSTIAADTYTQIFMKIASKVVQPIHFLRLQHAAPVLIQTSIISDTQLSKLLINFDDPNSEYDAIVPQLVYLYNLFKNKDVNIYDNPFRPGFWAKWLMSTGTSNLTVADQNRLSGWAPILIQNREINSQDIQIILSVTGHLGRQIENQVMLFRFFYRNKWIWWAITAIVIFFVIR